MKKTLFAAAVMALPISTYAEQIYDPSFHEELHELGLEREAFLYALQWAAGADPEAGRAVAYALLGGKGVDPAPEIGISFACKPNVMDDFELRRFLITANLRLIGSGSEKITCSD